MLPEHLLAPQYWSVSWVDPDIGRLFLEALAAARTGDRPLAERLLYSNLWSKWGTMYKYRSRSDLSKKARDAYERSVDLSPTYPWGFYELANIELEVGDFRERGKCNALLICTSSISKWQSH